MLLFSRIFPHRRGHLNLSPGVATTREWLVYTAHDIPVMYLADVLISSELARVVHQLQALTDRSDWWGPARLAFDAVVDDFCVRAVALEIDARAVGK